MVKRLPALASVLACSALLLLSFAAPASPQGLSNDTYTIDEQYTVEISPNGDARITDILGYDQEWFDEYGGAFKEYPNLLSRRYRGNTDVGEIENFDADVNERKGTVTITFDSPGYAYNFEDYWMVPGLGIEPSRVRDDEVVYNGTLTYTGEESLFMEMPADVEWIVKLPEGAANAKYDEGKGYLTYELPYKPAKTGNFMQNNKSVWIPIFIVLMVLSLLLLLYVIINGRRSGTPIAVAADPSSTVPTFAPTPPIYPTAPAAPEAPAAPATKFCKHCGGALKESDTRFCSNCGKPLG